MTSLNVEGMDKHKPINHFSYSEDELAEKKLTLHNLKIMYPTVSQYHADLIYDMCKNCSKEEIEELKIKADAPFKYNYTGLQEILDEKFKPMEPMTITSVKPKPEAQELPLEKGEPKMRVCDASQKGIDI